MHHLIRNKTIKLVVIVSSRSVCAVLFINVITQMSALCTEMLLFGNNELNRLFTWPFVIAVFSFTMLIS